MKTMCYNCRKEWNPKKWENFLTVYGVCLKQCIDDMEKQFRKRLPKIRVEEDGA